MENELHMTTEKDLRYIPPQVFFNYARDYFIKYGIACVYPSFIKEIDWYENYFSTHALLSEEPHGGIEQFQAIIKWRDMILYSMEWDICRMWNDINLHSFPAVKVSLFDKTVFCDDRHTCQDRVNEYVKASETQETPILLVWVDFIERYYVIDGNHRYVAGRQKGQKSINAFILPADFHLKYMLTEESRMRYKVFHNIVIMSKIMRYPGCKVSEEKDDGVFLYPITGNKIQMGLLRCFAIRLYTMYLFLRNGYD